MRLEKVENIQQQHVPIRELTESNVGLSWCQPGILGGALGTKSTTKCSISHCRIARRTSYTTHLSGKLRCLR